MSFYSETLQKVHFVVGILQLLTCSLYIGWFWSFIWGILILATPSNISAVEDKPQLSSERPLILDSVPK